MNFKLFVFALLIGLTLFGSLAFADLVTEANRSSDTVEISTVSFTEAVDSTTLDSSASAVSVPEPAAFGLISIALAVGGGLLVRRKTD